MLNNKGQSLILFVVVLPILLLILVLVIDVGNVFVVKQELSNISDIVLDYGLEHLDDEDLVVELERLVKLNKSDIDEIDITIENSRIHIELKDKIDGILSGLVDISIFDVSVSYVGYIEDEEKRIEKMGD